jgi:hypothetical protein
VNDCEPVDDLSFPEGRKTPDPAFAVGQVVDGRVVCGAKTRSGAPCRRSPAEGRTRCRLHGGATLAGPAHPRWRDGRHSKFVQGAFLEAYERARRDPDLLSLADELALVDARASELLDALGDGGSPADLWRALDAECRNLERAIAKGDAPAQRTAVAAILALRDQGRRTAATWGELDRLIERRRRVAETERRRIEAAQATVTVGELATIVAVLLADAKVAIGDPVVFTRVASVWRARLGTVIGPGKEEPEP